MITYKDDDYKIIKDSRGYVLINLNGEEKNHAHVQKSETCFLLIKLIARKIVPKSKYLQESAIRVTTDESYVEKILNKQAKNKDKEKYTNVNKGVR